MKKLLLLLPIFAIGLTGCDLPGGNGDSDDKESEDQETVEPPTLEELAAKHSGFEVTYLESGSTTVKVGAKGDLTWQIKTESSGSITNGNISVKKDNKFENYYYSSGSYVLSSTTDENLASMICNTYYVQYMQSGGVLSDLEYVTTSLNSEACRKYTISFTGMEIYVSEADGYTMQVNYNGETPIGYVSVAKGSNVVAPELSAE